MESLEDGIFESIFPVNVETLNLRSGSFQDSEGLILDTTATQREALNTSKTNKDHHSVLYEVTATSVDKGVDSLRLSDEFWSSEKEETMVDFSASDEGEENGEAPVDPASKSSS